MKKNYFKCFFKSYGIILTLLFILLFVALGFVTVISPGLINKTYTSMIKGVLLVALGGFALLGFTNLKSEKFSLLDFIRGVATVGTLIIVVMLLVKSSLGKMFMVMVACLVLFIIQLIFRIKNVNDECEESSFKNYFGALAGTFNPLIILLCGIVLAIVTSLLLDSGFNIAGYKNLILGAAIGLITVLLISGIDKDTEVTLLDFVLGIAFVTSIYLLVLSMNDLYSTTAKIVLLGIGISIAGLLLRGALYNKPRGYDNPAHKIRTYFKQVYDRFDATLTVGVGLIVLGLFACPFAAKHGANSIASVLNRIGLSDLTVVSIIAILAVVAFIALTFVFRKFTSTKVERVDGLLVSMLFASTFIIPFTIYVLIGKSITLSAITSEPLLLVVLILYLLLFVLAAVVQFIRFRNFDPLMALVGDKKYQVEADEEEDEEVSEETTEEEKEEAPYDPFALTEEDEALYASVYGEEEKEEAEEVVNEPQQEPIEEEVESIEESEPVQPEETIEETPVEETPQEDAEEDIEEDTEDEDDDTDDEAEEEDSEVQEETQEEQPQAKEAGVIVQDFQVVDEDGAPKKIKRKFNSKMMFAPYETKEYYNEIKNYLLCYRAKGRYSARCESFRYKGLVAKVALGGKSIKVFLALDPEVVDIYPKYHLKNVSDKKQYAEVPVMIKVRSPRGLKYFKELVDLMMAQRMVKPKRNYQPTNFIAQLIPNGEAILATLGMSTDYLHNTMNVRSIPEDMPDDLIDYIPMIPGEDLGEEEVEANVYLDTLCNHFEDGDEITIDVLKSLHIVTRGNVLRIKARGTLDRRLIIYAEKFDEDALKMLMCTNCTAIRIIRDYEE